MKKAVKILPFILLLICGKIAFTQVSFLDSIHVQIDNTMEFELAANKLEGLNGIITKDINNLQAILKESKAIPREGSYKITYVPDDMISIKQSGQNEMVIWKDNEVSINHFSNQCFVKAENYSLLFRFNEIDRLLADSLSAKVIEVIDAAMPVQSRFTSTNNFSFDGNKLIHNEHLDKYSGQTDLLSLTGGVGVNLIKNQPVVDISASMGFMFSKNGVLKNNFYLSYNSLADFSDSLKVKMNGFINFGYRYNFSNDIENPNWLGVEFGYLLSQHGDLFGKNTFKIGLNWDLGKNISVSPQYYFSDKLSYPALRIGIGF